MATSARAFYCLFLCIRIVFEGIRQEVTQFLRWDFGPLLGGVVLGVVVPPFNTFQVFLGQTHARLINRQLAQTDFHFSARSSLIIAVLRKYMGNRAWTWTRNLQFLCRITFMRRAWAKRALFFFDKCTSKFKRPNIPIAFDVCFPGIHFLRPTVRTFFVVHISKTTLNVIIKATPHNTTNAWMKKLWTPPKKWYNRK